MNKILDIKNRKLAMVLAANWLIDIFVGIILYFGLKKTVFEFFIATILIDLVFFIAIYAIEYIKKGSKYDVLVKGALIVRNIYLMFYYMEYFCGNSKNIEPTNIRFWLNGIIYVTIFVFIFSLIYRLPATVAVFNTFLFILLIANLFLTDERGLPFFFADLFSVGTAAEVMGSYTFKEWPEYLCIFIWFLTGTISSVYVLKLQSKTKPSGLKWNILIRVCGLGFTFGVLTLFLKTPLMADCGIEPYFWKHTKNGVALNLMMDLKYSNLEEPTGYDADELKQVAEGYTGDKGTDKKPNILVIMNESFTDLSVLGDFNTSEPVTPFMDSMEENTIKGTVFSSVYGGNTANSEYEFLTGDSMIAYPNGAVAYQTYLKGKTRISSLIRTLNKSGYETVSFHPNKPTNWNRVSIYKALRFRKSLWVDSVENPVNLRNHLSDVSDFETVKKLFDEKGDKPLFLFNITMQNHGGYLVQPFDNEIKVTTEKGDDYPKTEQYLTVIKQTDAAMKDLIEYFENYDEPTLILFYGDHHPKIDSNFIEDLLGGSMDNLGIEDLQKLYQTPFFIWANYDIEEKTGEKLSINYLSSYLCDVAGLPKTPYQQYLSELREKYPVINGNGVVDADGKYYTKVEALNELEEVKRYDRFIYNHMFDSKGYVKRFFEKK